MYERFLLISQQKKNLKFSGSHILMLTIGAIVGLLIGVLLFSSNDETQKAVAEIEQVKIVTQKIKDTVVVSEKVYVEVPVPDTLSETLVLDTLQIASFENMTDSLENIDDSDIITIVNDNDDDDDIVVIKDRLLRKTSSRITVIDLNDSLSVDKALNKEVLPFNEQINVEFWVSPLELTGYELSASKLKLFGFNPNEKLSTVYTKGNDFIEVKVGEVTLRLAKTERFKTIYL
jgi:hypothetical protein